MQDRPNAGELVEAVREFLTNEVVPACTDQRLRFRALIAANVLAVAGRDLATRDAEMQAAYARLLALNGAQPPGVEDSVSPLHEDLDHQLRILCAAIRAGAKDDVLPWKAAFDFAEWHVQAKLRVSNPKYLQSMATAAREPATVVADTTRQPIANNRQGEKP